MKTELCIFRIHTVVGDWLHRCAEVTRGGFWALFIVREIWKGLWDFRRSSFLRPRLRHVWLSFAYWRQQTTQEAYRLPHAINICLCSINGAPALFLYGEASLLERSLYAARITVDARAISTGCPEWDCACAYRGKSTEGYLDKFRVALGENHALIKRPSDVALLIGDSFENLNIIEADDYKKSGNKMAAAKAG